GPDGKWSTNDDMLGAQQYQRRGGIAFGRGGGGLGAGGFGGGDLLKDGLEQNGAFRDREVMRFAAVADGAARPEGMKRPLGAAVAETKSQAQGAGGAPEPR